MFRSAPAFLQCALVVFLLSLLLLPSALGQVASATAQRAIELTVFISLDGFRPDYVELYPESTPHLQALIAGGVRAVSCEGVFPSVTTPNMTSLVTGSYPATTGIACNTQYEREHDQIVGGPRDNRAETIAETLSSAGFKTAAVNHFMLENRGAQIYRKGDMKTVIELIRSQKPDFIAYYFSETDSVGHKAGPFSEEMRQTVAEADREIGQLTDALKEMNLLDKTLIAITSDHGMSPFESRDVRPHPVQALRAAGFKVVEGNKELEKDTEVIVIPAGSWLVYVRRALSEEREKLLVKTLESIEGARLLKRSDLDRLRAHNNRSGDYVLVPLEGYTMSGAGSKGGLHGRPSEKYTFLVLHGPGVKRGATIATANTVDVVPTLLSLLDVKPAATVDGKVLQDALEVGR